MAKAVARNKNSDYPVTDDRIPPDYYLLLDEKNLERVINWSRDVFLPYCYEQYVNKEKWNALDKKNVDRLIKVLDERDWETQPRGSRSVLSMRRRWRCDLKRSRP